MKRRACATTVCPRRAREYCIQYCGAGRLITAAMPTTALSPSPNTGPRTATLGLGHLGVTLTNHPLGVRVDRAHEADSIYRAGLRAGDVITAVDGNPVSDHVLACDLLGSNVDKLIVLHSGPQADHQVSFLPAAIAEQLMRERNSFSGMLSQIMGGSSALSLHGATEHAGQQNARDELNIMVRNAVPLVVLLTVVMGLMLLSRSSTSSLSTSSGSLGAMPRGSWSDEL